MSTGSTNERQAYRVALELVNRKPSADILLKDFLAPYYTDACPHVTRLRAEGKLYSEKTRIANRSILDRLILPDPVCQIKMGNITRGDILAFRARLMEILGPCRTVNSAMMALSVAIHEGIFQEIIDRDPCARVGAIKYDKKVRRALTLEELRLVLAPENHDTPQHWQATMVAAMTGMRAGEVRALVWGDMDAKKGRISITKALDQTDSSVTTPKWGKLRVTAYPAQLQAILEPLRREPDEFVFWSEQGVMGYKRWAMDFARASVNAGVKGATLHSLRHTLNTLLRGRGLAEDALRGSFGWSDPGVQEGYTHRELYDLSGQASAVDALAISPREGK